MKNLLTKTILGIFILVSAQFSWSQSEFFRQQLTNGAIGKSIAQLPDSGYIVVVKYTFGTNDDLTFCRTDKFGNILWYKRAAIPGNQTSMKKTICTSYNKYVTTSNTNINNSFAVHFLDSLGNSVSHKQFTYGTGFYESFRTDLAESPDKKVYALGTNHLVKMDSVGNVIWQKRFSGSNMNLTSVHPITSSKIILTGLVVDAQAINSDYDIVQICIDSAGLVLWSKSFGSRTQDKAIYSVYSNGKIYHVGQMDNYLSDRSGSYIFCTDTAGAQLWCKWVDSQLFYPRTVLLKDGTIVLNNTSTFLRFSESGDFIHGLKLNSPLGLYINDLIATNDGGMYLEAEVGSTSNIYGFKMAANLNPECLPILPYTPDTLFNQVLEEKPFVLSSSYATSVSTLTPTWSNLTFSSTSLCSSSCNVVAALKPNETQICNGESISFANNSQNASSYQWWIGSTLISTNTLFSYTFSNPGVYKVKLIASNGTCTDSTFTQISVRAPLDQPVFTYQKDHLKGWFNTEVPTFASTTWNFGDGSGNQQNIDSIVYNFKSVGTYTVCLTETNICGSVTTCENITFSIDSTFNFIKHYDENSFYNGRRWARGTHALYGGGFLLSGTDDTWGSTGWDGTLVKTDKKGNPLWTQIVTYGNDIDIEIPHITETHKGYLLLGGTNGASPYLGIMDSSGLTTYMLRLTTSSQGALSAKPYEKQNGNIIFSGCYGNQAFIAETDLGLGVFWFKRHTGIRTLHATIKTSTGFLMAGTDLTNTQIGLMKVDENGDYLSAAMITHTGSTPTAARDIVASLDGNYIVTGNSNGALYLMKIDSNYNVLWAKKYVVSGFGKSLSIDNSGNITVVTSGGVIVKTDPSGNVIGAWDPPGSSIYGAQRHTKTLDGGLIVAGTTYGYFSSTEEELSLFRFDNSGSFPTCYGSPITVTASSITANVTSATDVQTNAIPALTKNYSGNVYSSLQAEICASAAPYLDAGFTVQIGCAGNPTAFTNLSLGSVVSHSWSFQGGTPANSTTMNPSVIWNTPGTYTVSLTITGSDGSTNTQTMDVTIGAAPSANAGNDLITCAGTPIVLNGSGTGTLTWNSSSSMANPSLAVTSVNPLVNELFVLQAVSGNCSVTDTVMVTVNPLFMETTTATICSGMSYSFHGQNFMSSGIYSIPYSDMNGCDSTYTLNLTVNPPLSSSISAFICDGENYTVGTSIFSTTGVYAITLQNQAGCDSIVNLNLTVILPTTTVNAAICSGESYMVGNTSFTTAGTYTINLLNQNGCDSTVTLNLSVLPNVSATVNAAICSGESYIIGSNSFTTSGTYTIVLQNMNGCDSTVTLNLQVLPVSSSIVNEEICSGETYSFNGFDYSVSGTYTAVYTSANGCDSTVTLNLDVLNPSSSLTIVTICPGDSYLFNGTFYSSPGTYASIQTSVNGCDSTALLDLSINSIPPTILTDFICDGENYLFNGNVYTQTGTYSATLQSIDGCDSIVTLNLTVQVTQPTIIYETICFGETYFFNGNVYSSNGVYSDTLQTLNGCDSVIVLDLTILTPDIGINVMGTTLTANQSGATYEWINCDDLSVVGSQQSFIGIANNNYAVVVTWNNCSDTSDCYLVSDVGIPNISSLTYFVYPVPSDDIIYLVSPIEAKGQQYFLYDDTGREILSGKILEDKTIISLDTYSFGIYQLKVGNEGKVFKVIRQ